MPGTPDLNSDFGFRYSFGIRVSELEIILGTLTARFQLSRRFRPCPGLQENKVKQIIGGTLNRPSLSTVATVPSPLIPPTPARVQFILIR
jgi:hypothetical protein